MMTARTTPVFDATTNYNEDGKDNYGKDNDDKNNDGRTMTTRTMTATAVKTGAMD